jgi:hypothetical protein
LAAVSSFVGIVIAAMVLLLVVRSAASGAEGVELSKVVIWILLPS